MRFDDIDPDERDDNQRRRRRRKVIGLLAAVAILGGGIGGYFALRDTPKPVAAPVESVPLTVPDTVAPGPEVPFLPQQQGPNDFPDFGSDYQGDKLEQLAKRTTDDGITIVVQKLDWNNGFGGPGIIIDGPTREVHQGTAPPFPAAPIPTPPFPGGQNGWVPPAWCNPTGGFRVTMTHDDSIGTSQGQLYDEVPDDVVGTLFSSGYAEGHPFKVLVLQVSKKVTLVSVRFSDGAQDQAVAQNGIVILAAMGKRAPRFGLTLTVDGVEREMPSTDLFQQGNKKWQEDCTPPPPVLPPPGEQPANPQTEEDLVRERFGLLFDQGVSRGDKPDDLIDDRTGVDDALDAVAKGPFGDAAVTAEYNIDELVFTSPTEAWFRYTISTSVGVFGERFGIARINGGRWQILRAVLCQDLALAGAPCSPDVAPIQPPVPRD
jgi:hypothetical protein